MTDQEPVSDDGKPPEDVEVKCTGSFRIPALGMNDGQ